VNTVTLVGLRHNYSTVLA